MYHFGTEAAGVPAGAAALVTGAAADEHNLNVVDCDTSVTVPRLSSIPVLKWGSGGYPQPPEANVKDNGFPWPPPGLLGNFTENAVSPLLLRVRAQLGWIPNV